MSVLKRVAHFQNRRDEAPNLILAKELAAARDTAGIREIAENLWNANAEVQSDCIKVLYEIGASEPGLIAGYAGDFLKLLGSKNNRLVWGGMTALAAVSEVSAAELFKSWQTIRDAVETGSVITADQGILALARIAASEAARRTAIFPYLLKHLATCRPKDVPQRAEKIAAAALAPDAVAGVGPGNRAALVAALEKRLPELSAAQAARVKKVIKRAAA